MAAKRTPLWDSDSQASYWDDTKAAELKAAARQDGEDTARALDAAWAALSADERCVMDYLLLSDKRSLVGLYEDALYRMLVSKGLLQIPPGVGTLLMHKLETTFRVPKAVWRAMADRKSALLPYDAAEAGHRLQQVSAFVGARRRASRAGDPVPGTAADDPGSS